MLQTKFKQELFLKRRTCVDQRHSVSYISVCSKGNTGFYNVKLTNNEHFTKYYPYYKRKIMKK